ncbi:type III polyketide synthase [Phragmitibacter flavus]|uniref:Type III polyketide synthase n=1 Tax=Phragmitibacter flavus TaxID=2576071 RepID=A0A5R8KKG4_9BACT|nr:type III polyketide synthase [Phragmitibacter flavus]TLD72823.1 type III polyketide synthase [Phragmitibacter flavus]
MPAFIHHLSTLTPTCKYRQDFVRDRMKSWAGDEKTRRMIHAVYNRSGIDTRYSVLDDFRSETGGTLFQNDSQGIPFAPGTAERNAVFATEARSMSVELARKILLESDFAPEEITHLVFASCTGFANPGPDFHIIRELGLSDRVERYTVGFMGCYAAFPALRMAAQFCEANPDAVVMVMCLELCTLHMQLDAQPDNLLANSLFADGAAAAIVSAREPDAHQPAFRLNGFRSCIVPNSETHMAWEIGNHGFNIVLSSYVPDILGTQLEPVLQTMLLECGIELSAINEWAVHPGGRAILDKVSHSLALPEDALDIPRAILRDYGNMSSATVLFVLKAMLENAKTPEAKVCALAFGPGLTVESAVLERCGGPTISEAIETVPDELVIA